MRVRKDKDEAMHSGAGGHEKRVGRPTYRFECSMIIRDLIDELWIFLMTTGQDAREAFSAQRSCVRTL